MEYSKDLPNGKLHLSLSLQRPHTVTIETGTETPHLLSYAKSLGLQIISPCMLEGHLLPFHTVLQPTRGSLFRKTSTDCSQKQESDRQDVLLRAFCCAADLLRVEVCAARTGAAKSDGAVQRAFLIFTAQLLFPTSHRLEVRAGWRSSSAASQLRWNRNATLRMLEVCFS